jgi:predicted nucleic acid-binding protein
VAGLTLDSGALIALERGDKTVRAWLDDAFRRGQPPTVPTVTIAETWRGSTSARIARLLKSCRLEPLDENLARAAGQLRGKVPGSATIDAVVIVSAAQRGDIVLTQDVHDLVALADRCPSVRVERV